jgi:hypothetical protein
VDAVLANVHTFVEENQLSEIGIPDIEATFSKEVEYFMTESVEE